MTIRYRRFVYGQLNPVEKPRMQGKFTSNGLTRQRFTNVMRENVHKQEHGVDALANTGPYYGIVLKRIINNDGASIPVDNPMTKFLGKTSDKVGETLIIVKVRIPEIHAHIPDPFDFNIGTPQFINLIESHPTFVGYDVSDPVPGNVVLVDFQNRNNFTGPIYLSMPQQDQNMNVGLGYDIVNSPINAFAGSYGGAGAGGGLPDGTVNISQLCNTLQSTAASGDAIGGEKQGDAATVSTDTTSATAGDCVTLVGGTTGEQLLAEMKELQEEGRVPKETKQFVYENIQQTLAYKDIVERFWRTLYPSAVVEITSLVRGTDKNSVKESAHGHGIAMDVQVKTSQGYLSCAQVYIGYRRLIAAGLLPPGGLGIYVNLKNFKQDFSHSPSRKKSPGASANVHYDWRNSDNTFTGTRSLTKNKYQKTSKWVWLDVDGDGSDEYSTPGSTDTTIEINEDDIQSGDSAKGIPALPSLWAIRYGDAWKTDAALAKYGITGIPNV